MICNEIAQTFNKSHKNIYFFICDGDKIKIEIKHA